jgi:hypothetical protein
MPTTPLGSACAPRGRGPRYPEEPTHPYVRPRGCPSMELRLPSTDSNPSGQAKESLSRGSTRGSHSHHSDTTENAIRCNTERPRAEKVAQICGICKPLHTPATPDRTLVMSRSAVRVRSSALYFYSDLQEECDDHKSCGRKRMIFGHYSDTTHFSYR